jgi:hypothetical protein
MAKYAPSKLQLPHSRKASPQKYTPKTKRDRYLLPTGAPTAPDVTLLHNMSQAEIRSNQQKGAHLAVRHCYLPPMSTVHRPASHSPEYLRPFDTRDDRLTGHTTFGFTPQSARSERENHHKHNDSKLILSHKSTYYTICEL